MMDGQVLVTPVRVLVEAPDVLDRAGVDTMLRSRPELAMLTAHERRDADVLVVVCDRLDAAATATLRHAAGEVVVPVLLVATEVSDTDMLTAIECRVVGVLPRLGITGEQLSNSILTAVYARGMFFPPGLGPRPQRPVTGLSTDDIHLLQLVSDGWTTSQIARHLQCSNRNVKDRIYRITRRLKMRNRCQAVAFALRTGLI